MNGMEKSGKDSTFSIYLKIHGPSEKNQNTQKPTKKKKKQQKT